MMVVLNYGSVEIEERTLFPLCPNFRIVKLGEKDAKGQSDHFNNLKELIALNQDMYPNIEKWFFNKVIPGIITTQRIGYVAYENEEPIASCILKKGDRSKFCHLRIHEDFQDLDLGQVFFTQMTLAIRDFAKEIHFTLPENLWYKQKGFFESFGFTKAIIAPNQYRHGITELMCSAPHATVWSAAIEKLPRLMAKFSIGGYSLQNNILMSIKPGYVEKILSGIKTIEIRRKFSSKWIGNKVVLYASNPLCALIGEALISKVSSGQPNEVWNQFSEQIGCTREEFNKYTEFTEKIYAIELSNLIPYRSFVFLTQIEHLLGNDLKPPQSYCLLDPKKPRSWAHAVSIVSFLHGKSIYFI
ncbi:MAG: ASCH domain-containing protein [Spirochaetales bacterium]|nr:ASCH domain-containing protein [Spirochaetales bacterium]